MKNRKTFAMICYVVCIIACLAAGVVSLMAFTQKITYTLGFLLFVPIWIGSYWFLSFFNALSREKNGEVCCEKIADQGAQHDSEYIKRAAAVFLGICVHFQSAPRKHGQRRQGS